MLKSGVFHINGHAAYNGYICIPFQFQAYTAGKLPCTLMSKSSQLSLSISYARVFFTWSMIMFITFLILLQLFLGIIVCMMSLHMYFAPPNMLVDMPSPTKAAPENLKEISVERKTDTWWLSRSGKLMILSGA